LNDGHLIRWQKSKALITRIFSPFLVAGDQIIDPFMGSGTAVEVAIDLGCDYIGIEMDEEPYNLAMNRITKYMK
jgi:site-specific DNA-methyltransferase (adenine-specific)